MNFDAQPATTAVEDVFYGTGVRISLGRASLGFGGGVFDLGRKAFGRD